MTIKAAVQRVLVFYTASRATWVSALPSSASVVEESERKCSGKHAKGQRCYCAWSVLFFTQAVLAVSYLPVLCVQLPVLRRTVFWGEGYSHSCI